MKVVKVLIAIVIAAGLLLAQGLLAGIISCNKSISRDAIAESIQNTDFTQQLCQQVLQKGSRKADEKTLAFLKEALKTETASRFMGEYAASSIDSMLHGTEVKAFTKEDLQDLTDDSLEELSSKSGIPVSSAQKKLVTGYIDKNADYIVKSVNHTLLSNSPAAVSGTDNKHALEQIRFMLSPSVSIFLSGFCLILGILLILLFWKSRLGFIWWAVISFLDGSAYFLVGNSSSIFSSYIRETGDGTTFSLLLTDMLSHGFTFAGLCGFGLTVLLTGVCLILRKGFGH